MKQLILFFILLSCAAFSQDASFVNNQQSLIYSNPSFAGKNGLVRSQSAYSMQGATGYKTAMSSVDGFIKPIKAGVAVMAFSDDMGNGTLRNNSISFSYAQYIYLKSKARLIPSFQLGMGQLSLDRTKLNFGDMINPRYNERWNNALTLPASQKNYTSLGAGLRYSRHGESLGIYFYNINRPDIGLAHSVKLPVRASIYISEDMMSDLDLKNISFLGNFQPGSYNMLLKWTLTLTKYVLLAAGYSGVRQSSIYGHGAVANCGLHYKAFTLMYGFNKLYMINSDWKPQKGSHEISLSISPRKKDDPDPRFFGRDPEKW
jgi:type IX secretion system PorP/SprF family membrane protein